MENINLFFYLVIIGVAIISFIFFNWSILGNIKELKLIFKIINSVDENNIHDLQEQVLNSHLSTYSKNIFNRFFSQYQKYQTNISNHINIDNFVYKVKPYGSNTIPGILTALGILGTFLGLILGIKGMDTSSAETMMLGINQILGGLYTAFITSILGISCSIIWNIVDKSFMGMCIKTISSIEDAFILKFNVAEEEAFEEYFKRNQEEQKEILEHLATDISVSIGNAFNDSVSNNITPIFEQINGMFEKMADTTADTYVEGIDAVANQFIESMNKSLSGQFENLSSTIIEICEWQKQIKADMGELINEIQESVRDQKEINLSTESVIEKFSGMFNTLTDRTNTLNEDFINIYEKSNNLNSIMAENIQSLNDSSEQFLISAKEQNESVYKTQQELSQQLEMSIINNKEIYQNIENVSDIVGKSRGVIESLDETLKNSTTEFKENMHSGIMKSFETFDENMGKISGYLNSNIENLSDALQKMEESVEEVKNSIFMINDNYEKYAEHRYKSVEKNIENSIDNILIKFNGLKLVGNDE